MRKSKKRQHSKRGATAAATAPAAAAAPPVVVDSPPVDEVSPGAAPADLPPAPPAPAPVFVEEDAAAGLTPTATDEPPAIFRVEVGAVPPPPDELPPEEPPAPDVDDAATAAANAAAPPPPEEVPPEPPAPAPAEPLDEEMVDLVGHTLVMLNLGALHFGSHFAFHVDLNPATPADVEAGKRAYRRWSEGLAEKLHLSSTGAKVALWNIKHVATHHPALAGPPHGTPDPDDEPIEASATTVPPGDPAG